MQKFVFFFGGKTPIENDMNETNLCESFSAIYKTRRPHHLSLHVDNFLLHQFYALKQFFHILLFWNLHISLILFPCFFSSLFRLLVAVVTLSFYIKRKKKHFSDLWRVLYCFGNKIYDFFNSSATQNVISLKFFFLFYFYFFLFHQHCFPSCLSILHLNGFMPRMIIFSHCILLLLLLLFVLF